jgi:hypothetical protein
MNPVANTQGKQGRVEDLIALIDELIAITGQENTLLAKGWPASQLIPFKRKAELAELFQPWAAAVASQPSAIFTSDKALHAVLIERLNALQTIMTENITSLRAAIEASQRRINAVMMAIREQMSAEASYSAKGQAQAPSISSYVANVRA